MIGIVVNVDSLEHSTSGNIIGQICLRGPSGYFPSETWRDFPAVILAWWVEGLGLVASGDRRSFVGEFMEGPFSYRINAGEGEIGRIAWGELGAEADIATVSIPALLQSAISAGRIISESCRARGWQSNELERLEQVLPESRPNNSFKPNMLRSSKRRH